MVAVIDKEPVKMPTMNALFPEQHLYSRSTLVFPARKRRTYTQFDAHMDQLRREVQAPPDGMRVVVPGEAKDKNQGLYTIGVSEALLLAGIGFKNGEKQFGFMNVILPDGPVFNRFDNLWSGDQLPGGIDNLAYTLVVGPKVHRIVDRVSLVRAQRHVFQEFQKRGIGIEQLHLKSVTPDVTSPYAEGKAFNPLALTRNSTFGAVLNLRASNDPRNPALTIVRGS